MRIRPETEADRAAVRAVNLAAFETSAEADLVDALRNKGVPLLSLIAEVDGEVVGHVLFSPVSLTEHSAVRVMGLGPMAVVPAYQRKGIGSALAQHGLARCRQAACHAVVVVGHADYYPRFGFVPAVKFGITCEYDVPEDVFMIVELERGALRDARGLARYDEGFGGV